MTERCPKCGSEMVRGSEELPWYCPRAPEYCRIAELERQLEEAKAVALASMERGTATDQEKCELARQLAYSDSLLRASEARERELQATNERLLQDRLDYSNVSCKEGMNSSEWIWRTGKAERERDAALDQVVALRWEMEALRREANQALNTNTTDEFARSVTDKVHKALSNTSATAQQRVEAIRREAVEAAVERVSRVSSGKLTINECEAVRRAILGEKEG